MVVKTITKKTKKISKRSKRKNNKNIKKSFKKVSKRISKKISKKVSPRRKRDKIRLDRFTPQKILGWRIYTVKDKDNILEEDYPYLPSKIKRHIFSIFRERAFRLLEKIVYKLSKKLANKNGEEILESFKGYSDYIEYIEECVDSYKITPKTNYLFSRMNKNLVWCFLHHLTSYLLNYALDNYQTKKVGKNSIIIDSKHIKDGLYITKIDKIIKN